MSQMIKDDHRSQNITDAKATLKKKLAESTEELQRAQTELSQAN